MKRLGAHLLAATALAASLSAACGKRPGQSCAGAASACMDKTSALACHGGALVAVACAGPAGCKNFDDHANCDTSVASAGDACMGEDDEYACTPDGKRALACKAGRFSPHLECRGAGGCKIVGGALSCDTTLGAKGDPCKKPGALTCSEDRTQLLMCKSGALERHRYCRGQRGCTPDAEAPSCDVTLSLAGDPCGVPGQVVCAVDGKSELVCEHGVFTRSLACKTGCTVTGQPGRPIECK